MPAPPPIDDTTSFCPFCGASYPSSQLCCEEDGTPLQKMERFVLPRLNVEEPVREPVLSSGQAPEGGPPARREGRRATLLMKAALGIVILLCLVVGYRYFVSGPENSARIEGQLGRALKTRGLDVAVGVGKDGAVTATGTVGSNPDKNAALAIIRAHREVKAVIDAIKVAPSHIEMERVLNEELDGAGLTGVQSHVDNDFKVTLVGAVRNETEKMHALKIARAHKEAKEVEDGVRIKKTSPGGAGNGEKASFTETKRFKLAGLSPSSWASLKYRDSITFTVPGPGRLLVEAKWESQGALALILNNAETGAAHAQKDGASPLKLTYRITPQDFIAKGSRWEATIANFAVQGAREGVLKVAFTAGFSDGTEVFNAGKLEGEINRALADGGLKGVAATVGKDRIATLKGSVRSDDEKQKALDITKRFKLIKTVKDIIFVVGL